MRELGFAIVGAVALIGLGLWAISKADADDDWTASAQRVQSASPASSPLAPTAPRANGGSNEDLD